MHLWSWALGVWLCSSRDVLHPTRDVTSRVLDRDDLDVDTCPLTYIQSHRRRSDWNSGGGTYYKSPAVKAKHIFLHCNATNLVLKIMQHDKIWGDNPLATNSGGGLVPP